MDTEMLSESELDVWLRKCDPVNRAALGDERVGAALTGLQLGVESGGPRRRVSSRQTHRLASRRWVRLGAAAGAVAVASLVGVETLTGGGAGGVVPLAVPAAAAAQLDKLARAAAGQVTPGAGQWTYVESRHYLAGTATVGNASIAYTDAWIDQSWYGADEARSRSVFEGVSFATPQDKATYLDDASRFDEEMMYPASWPTGKVIGDQVVANQVSGDAGPQQISEEAQPPTNPQVLIKEDLGSHEVALTNGNPETPYALWIDLSEILMDSSSAQLRATAYAALAYVPYTSVLGQQTDQLGRSGIAIAFMPQGPALGPDGADNANWTLIVSPSTGDLLQEESTLATASGERPAGTLLSREIFLSRAVVSSDTALPGGGTVPQPASRTTNAPTGETPTTSASPTTTAPPSPTLTTDSTASEPTTAPRIETATAPARRR